MSDPIENPPYIDDLTCREVYAESVQVLLRPTGAVTIEFCVNRWSHEAPVRPNRMTPVARIAMAPALAAALKDQIIHSFEAAKQQAELAQAPAASPTKN